MAEPRDSGVIMATVCRQAAGWLATGQPEEAPCQQPAQACLLLLQSALNSQAIIEMFGLFSLCQAKWRRL